MRKQNNDEITLIKSDVDDFNGKNEVEVINLKEKVVNRENNKEDNKQ